MGFNFKKKFGQNFLQDKNVINDIISSISVTKNDLIIEIGPGEGALTKKLVKTEAKVLAYEIDLDLESKLKVLENDKVRIIFDDFLKRDILNDISNIDYDNLYIVGNLPYYITTPIITKIIEEKILPKEMLFMVQKEVGERFSAGVSTREYGSITVFLNYYFDIKTLFIVNRNKFYPIPNVDSAVIKLVRRDHFLDTNFMLFNKFVKDSFNFKRKNLRNNLKSYDLDKLANILSLINKSLDNRAEDLSCEDFVFITNKYYND